MLRLLLICFLLLTTCACALLQNHEGNYVGVIQSNGTDKPAETVFLSREVGEVSATYRFLDNGKEIYGQLRACSWQDFVKVRCQWRDQFGQGAFEAVFSEDFRAFAGVWSVGNQTPLPFGMRWTGERQ